MAYDSAKPTNKGLTLGQISKTLTCPKCKCTIIMKDGKTFYEVKPNEPDRAVGVSEGTSG